MRSVSKVKDWGQAIVPEAAPRKSEAVGRWKGMEEKPLRKGEEVSGLRPITLSSISGSPFRVNRLLKSSVTCKMHRDYNCYILLYTPTSGHL